MEYPYTKYYFGPENVVENLVYIANTPAQQIPKDFHGERLAGYFVDPVRIMCKRSDEHGDSPYSYWINNRQQIEQEANGNIEEMDAILYRNVRGCSSFFPQELIKMLDKYKPKSLFDPCAGWGERLIACMLRNVKYVGVDPNSLMQYYYSKIIDEFGGDLNRFRVIHSRAEDVKLGTETFDMVYTSPPFWDVEIYSNEGSQSSNSKSLKSWIVDFLFVLLDIAWNRVNAGGVMCIYLTSHEKLSKDSYVNQMIRYMASYFDAEQLPSEAYRGQNVPNIYIWKKSAMTDNTEPEFLELNKNNFTIQTIPVEGGIKNFVIKSYLNTFAPETQFSYLVHYGDDVFKMLARAVNDSKKRFGLKLYLPVGEKKSQHELLELGAETIFYKDSPNNMVSVMRIDADKEDREILERSLFDNVMEALCFNEMQVRLEKIKQPERVWIRIKSGLTLYVMLRIWTKTTFLCSYPYEPNKDFLIKTLGHDMVRRMIIYHNKDKLPLEKMRMTFGYPDDLIL